MKFAVSVRLGNGVPVLGDKHGRAFFQGVDVAAIALATEPDYAQSESEQQDCCQTAQ